SYPLNLLLVAVFSGLIGWSIGPTIAFYGMAFRLKKFAKSQGIMLKKGETLNNEQRAAFARFSATTQTDTSHSIVSQAMFATACAVFATAGVVFLTNYDFSFLGGFLFIALLILVAMGLLNIFFYRSRIVSLVRAYIGVVLFTLYLVFDFDRLEKMANDQSWGAAVDIAVNIYLDIINLFLSILEILGDSSD
ncbi:Bax inhibitor-1 family protein, partial [Candidatus Uhrbacteria bacterium]|nr:Bax inhibitor-1 family protein [Candidatus Uhrbacteria bacterium]